MLADRLKMLPRNALRGCPSRLARLFFWPLRELGFSAEYRLKIRPPNGLLAEDE